jgi:hypothetical protein
MSVVRKFHVKARLATLIRQPGGMHVGEALKRGEAALAAQREGCLVHIDAALERIEGLIATPGYDPEVVYEASADIVALCAVFTDDSLASVSRSLCELIDRASEGGTLDDRSVQVHLASMRLLHRTDAGPEARAAIVDGLAKLLDRQSR